jgi:hypothetical protein
MRVEILQKIDLRHRPDHLTVDAEGSIATAADGGAGTIVWHHAGVFAFETAHCVSLTIHCDGVHIAVAGSRGIFARDESGWDEFLAGEFISCRFDSEGHLWTCRKLDADKARLERWDASRWTKLAETDIADPFGDSHFELWPHPTRGAVTVWAAAGQDGQALYWAIPENDQIQIEPFADLDETTPPAFSPNGDEFLIVSEGTLRRYAYPSGQLLGSVQPDEDDEDGWFAEYIAYAGAERAVLTTLAERLVVVDLRDMEILGEIEDLNASLVASLPGHRVVSAESQGNLGTLTIWQLP